MTLMDGEDCKVYMTDSEGKVSVELGGMLPNTPYLVTSLTCFMQPRTLFRVKYAGNAYVKPERVVVSSKRTGYV